MISRTPAALIAAASLTLAAPSVALAEGKDHGDHSGKHHSHKSHAPRPKGDHPDKHSHRGDGGDHHHGGSD